MNPNQARQMPTLELQTILAGISSTDPCPGAGAAGGVALALAAACARKAFRITASHEEDDVALLEADDELAAIMAAACQGAADDALLFNAFISALRMPHSDEGASAERDQRLSTEAGSLIENGSEMLALGRRLKGILDRWGPRIRESMKNDLTASLALIEANEAIQIANSRESERYVIANSDDRHIEP